MLKEKKTKNHNIFLSIDSHHDQNNWEEKNFIDLTKILIKKRNINKIYINFSPNKIKKYKNIYKKFLREKKNNFYL